MSWSVQVLAKQIREMKGERDRFQSLYEQVRREYTLFGVGDVHVMTNLKSQKHIRLTRMWVS